MTARNAIKKRFRTGGRQAGASGTARMHFRAVGLAAAFLIASVATVPAAAVQDEPKSGPAAERTVLDDTGFAFPIPDRPPARIVSMAPNVTEILFALGLGDRVVGDTRFCDYPPAAAAPSIARIGGLVDPSIEIIQSLHPDLVIAFRGNPIRVVHRLRELGCPIYVLDAGGDFESLFLTINKVGLVTARTSEAARLTEGLRVRVAAAAASASSAGSGPRPKVLFLLPGKGLWTAGRASFLTGLAAKAGVTNAAADLRAKWSAYKKERLAADDPDAIFILAPSEGAYRAARADLEKMFAGMDLRAFRNGRVLYLDENSASRLGPRLVDCLERTVELLHSKSEGDGP